MVLLIGGFNDMYIVFFNINIYKNTYCNNNDVQFFKTGDKVCIYCDN